MGKLVNKVTDTLGLTDSGAAADATAQGYATMSAAQREALEYMKEIDKLPREMRDKALGQFANIYGQGDEGAQAEYYAGLEEDPFYQQIMGTMDDRQESYLRTQGATGDLRGGESIRGVGDIAADTRNQALVGAHENQLQGLRALMGLPTHEKDIYKGMIGIGDTEGRGQIAVGQTRQDADQAGFNNAMGIAKLASGAGWI